MDYLREFPLSQIDRRPRKRPRVNWDNNLSSSAQSGLYSGREVGNGTSFGPSRLQSDHSSHLVRGLTQKGSPPRRDDDKDGHYIFELGENLTPRYKILKKIGEGTFGQVLECFDRETRETVAVKIIRSIKKYRDAAMTEVDVLKRLGRHNGYSNGCVQIRNWFDYRNHICIVFEMLGPSLFDFLRRNSYRPFPVDLVREIGRQLLECVACLSVLSSNLFYLGLIVIALHIYVKFWFILVSSDLHWNSIGQYMMICSYLSWVWHDLLAVMHDLHLIHTDLKPENILFVSSEYVKLPDYKGSSRDGSQVKRLPKSCAIKVIDFGSTASGQQSHHYLVSTRHYRAPEVILGLGWSYPCDMWSVGCILAELCSGEALFQTHDNLEHLAMMERVLGPLPEYMLRKVDRHAEKYTKRGRLNWPEGATSRESIRAVQKLPRLQNWVMQSVDHSAGDLIDLLQSMLQYEAPRRVTAHEALRHPFFTRNNFRLPDAHFQLI